MSAEPVRPAPRVSVVVPAHNEEAYLTEAVTSVSAGLRALGVPSEILVVENGSSDATAEVAGRLAGTVPDLRVLQLRRPDYGAALRAGFRAARGEVVVNFDVDLVDLGFLADALRLIDADPSADVVIGTKRGAGARDRRTPVRRLVTGGFSLVMRHGFGLRVSDTHGSKMLRTDPLRPLVDQVRSSGDLFDTELVLRAERAGLRVEEIPVTVEERRPARTPIAARVVRSAFGLARLRVLLWQSSRPARSTSTGRHRGGDDHQPAAAGSPAARTPVPPGPTSVRPSPAPASAPPGIDPAPAPAEQPTQNHLLDLAAAAQRRRRTRRLPHPAPSSSSHRPDASAARYSS